MATPVSSSSAASPTPSGCDAGDFRPGYSGSITGGFAGCVVNNATALTVCCASVGSTAGFINETCGCPFNAAFPATANISFFECVHRTSNGTTSACGHPNTGLGAGVRWNAAVIVLGAALVLGVVV
ncbi:hypothetical protein DFH09DRAFT_1320421 [Mycena vulgaris]|nr:hypothetical protein DFH09DRAFT_1320421 [Mycena vulgaris]